MPSAGGSTEPPVKGSHPDYSRVAPHQYAPPGPPASTPGAPSLGGVLGVSGHSPKLTAAGVSGEGVQGRSLLAGGDAEVAAGGGQGTVSHEGVDDATVDANGQQSCSVAGGRRPPVPARSRAREMTVPTVRARTGSPGRAGDGRPRLKPSRLGGETARNNRQKTLRTPAVRSGLHCASEPLSSFLSLSIPPALYSLR